MKRSIGNGWIPRRSRSLLFSSPGRAVSILLRRSKARLGWIQLVRTATMTASLKAEGDVEVAARWIDHHADRRSFGGENLVPSPHLYRLRPTVVTTRIDERIPTSQSDPKRNQSPQRDGWQRSRPGCPRPRSSPNHQVTIRLCATVTSCPRWLRCISPLRLALCRSTGLGWRRPRFRRTPSSQPAAEPNTRTFGSARPCRTAPWPWIRILAHIRLGGCNGEARLSDRSLRTCASCRLAWVLFDLHQPPVSSRVAVLPSRRALAVQTLRPSGWALAAQPRLSAEVRWHWSGSADSRSADFRSAYIRCQPQPPIPQHSRGGEAGPVSNGGLS
jgi:hypothetical protein